MDTVRHHPTEVADKNKQKAPIGTAELAPGKFGQAVKFTFAGGLGAGFMTGAVRPTPEWNQAKGFSFYVKGDGSTNWGGLELIDKDNYGLRFGYCFPIESTDWQKITVAWQDLMPELSAPLVDAKNGYAPSRFANFWFGKWFYWRDYPAHSYVIDQIALEKDIPAPAIENASTGLKRFAAKLKAKQAVAIVTMGDSLTDKRHWANQKLVWAEIFAQQLKTNYGSKVQLVNPAMGGTTLSQNIVVMPRWVRQTPNPDLVTVWFGFNDWDSGVRGPHFKEYLALAVDRIRQQTQGSADILLFTTCPAHSRWDTMKEMEQAVREVAAEKGTGLADVAPEIRQPGSADAALKENYWAWDKTHLGAKGHEVAAATALKAIQKAE
jgi:lysophospholipase L1-like esterase